MKYETFKCNICKEYKLEVSFPQKYRHKRPGFRSCLKCVTSYADSRKAFNAAYEEKQDELQEAYLAKQGWETVEEV